MEYAALVGIISQVLEKVVGWIHVARQVQDVKSAGGSVPLELIEKEMALRAEVEAIMAAKK